MLPPPSTLFEVWNLYQKSIQETREPRHVKNILNETQSALFRLFLPGLNPTLRPAGKKMTAAETQAARNFMQASPPTSLIEARAYLAVELASCTSLNSQKTYGKRLEQFLQWCEGQYWWASIQTPVSDQLRTPPPDESCPRLRRGFGKANRNHLTERRSIYPAYTLGQENLSLTLQAELESFFAYLTEPDHHERYAEAIKDSSANIYIRESRKMLGWFNTHAVAALKDSETALAQIPAELSCASLIPVLTIQQLSSLSSEEKETYWSVAVEYLNIWLCAYFEFSREIVESKSPRTKKFRTQTLIALCKFLYRNEVGSDRDYRNLPIFQAINAHDRIAKRTVNRWNRHGERVVPIHAKWPDIVAGESALKTVQKTVTQDLRAICQPIYSSNLHLRSGSVIATNLRDYIAWAMLSHKPARRQEELRSLRVWLSCPVERPSDVPSDGVYHPLPSEQQRAFNRHDELEDNYLYKTYTCKGQYYPKGIWVLDICRYKTDKSYGHQSIVIRNYCFADGLCFYDYIERYLYGWWRLDAKKPLMYTWWNPQLYGQKGHWVSQGRGEFQSCSDVEQIQNEVSHFLWGYFFLKPRTGTPYDDKEFAQFFSIAAHKLIGKRIHPHLLRDMWATWAFQVQLTDHQREALAYAMGMDVRTMQEIYQKCTPEEKRRPIEDVIDQVFFDQLETEYQQFNPQLEELAEELLALNSEELSYYEKQFLNG